MSSACRACGLAPARRTATSSVCFSSAAPATGSTLIPTFKTVAVVFDPCRLKPPPLAVRNTAGSDLSVTGWARMHVFGEAVDRINQCHDGELHGAARIVYRASAAPSSLALLLQPHATSNVPFVSPRPAPPHQRPHSPCRAALFTTPCTLGIIGRSMAGPTPLHESSAKGGLYLHAPGRRTRRPRPPASSPGGGGPVVPCYTVGFD